MAKKFNTTDKPQPAKYISSQSPEDLDLVSKIQMWKEDSEEWVGTWESNQEKYHKMRMRIKKEKNFPFSGCANIRMPTIETKIRKLKAALANVLMGIRPIVQVTPTPSGNWMTAKKVEKFLDHLCMNVIKIKNKILIAIDQTLEKGFYLVKPYWKVEITLRQEKLSLDDISVEEAMWLFAPERRPEEVAMAIQKRFDIDMSPRVAKDNKKAIDEAVNKILAGEDDFTIEVQDVICDYPDIALCPPERTYVPTTSGYDPQNCEYIIHEFLMPFEQVKANAEYKGWNKLATDEIALKATTDLDDKNLDTIKDEREGIERLQSCGELVKIWECYCWYDINGDGVKEKCVVTIAPDFNKQLRKITLPFYNGKFPFIKFFYELLDDRWFSHRGIPELIEDIVKEIDITHMQKLDYGTIANSPMFLYRAGMVGKNTTNFLFGQGLPVHGMQPLSDTFAPLNKQNPNVEFSYEREQMLLETKVEELIGQVDFTLQSMINKRQPRTLGEVQMQQQNMQQVFSLDADMFRDQFAEVLNWIYALWCQYGDDQYEFMYFGQGMQQGERIKLTKEELQGKYNIVVRGNDQNTNPQARLQKAQLILQDTYAALQMGLVSPQSAMNARRRAFEELNIDNPEEFLIPPQPQAPSPRVRINAKDLTDGEMAQVLGKQGIQPDIRGREMNEQNRNEELEFDQLSKVAETIGKSQAKNNK